MAAELVEVAAEGEVLARQGAQSGLGGLDGLGQVAGAEPGAALCPLWGCERLQAAAQLLGGGVDEVADLVGDAGAVRAGRAQRDPQRPDRLDYPVVALGRGGGVSAQRGAGGGFGVDGVGLAAPAAHLAVRSDHLHHLDPGAEQVTGEPHPIGAGALDPGLDDRPERANPALQSPIARRVRRERLCAQHPTRLVDDRRDVEVLVSVDTAVDADDQIRHDEVLPSLLASGVGTTGRDGGQDSQGGLPKAPMRSRPPDRSVRASSRDTGSTDHRKGTRPVTPWVRSEPRPLTPTS